VVTQREPKENKADRLGRSAVMQVCPFCYLFLNFGGLFK